MGVFTSLISEKVQNPEVIVARPSVKTWIHSRFPTPTPTHIALFLLPLQWPWQCSRPSGLYITALTSDKVLQ